MKTRLKTALACGGLVLAATLPSHGATTIAQWTFETSIPTTAGPHAPEVGSGSAVGFHAAATVYSNPVGNGSAESFSSTAWAIGDYYEFSSATTGYEDLTISWAQTSSSSGPGEFKLAYSTDGASFTDFLDYTVLPNQVAAPGLGAWNATTEILGYNFSADLSAVTALDNDTSVFFRLIMRTTADATPPGTVLAAGTDRVDNFTISGTALVSEVPEASTWYAGLGVSLAVLGVVLRRNRR